MVSSIVCNSVNWMGQNRFWDIVRHRLAQTRNESSTNDANDVGKMSRSTGVKYALIVVKLNRKILKFIGKCMSALACTTDKRNTNQRSNRNKIVALQNYIDPSTATCFKIICSEFFPASRLFISFRHLCTLTDWRLRLCCCRQRQVAVYQLRVAKSKCVTYNS